MLLTRGGYSMIFSAILAASVALALVMFAPSLAGAQSGDTDRPGRVTGLTASASNGEVALSWTAPADGATVTGYRILRRIPGSEPKLSPVEDDTGSDATSYTDSEVERGTEYVYRVEALNGAVAGQMSMPAKIRVPRPPKPGRITNLAAAWYGDKTVQLKWDAPVDGAEVTGYRVLRRAPGLGQQEFTVQNSDTGKTLAGEPLPGGPTTVYTDVKRTRYGTRYIYLVYALSGEVVGKASEPLRYTTPPMAVEALAARAGSDGTVTLTWGAPSGSVTGYRIFRRVIGEETQVSVLVADTNSGAASYNDKTVELGHEYVYRVQPIYMVSVIDVKEFGEISRPAGVKTPPSLSEPTLAASSVFYGTVNLTWNAPVEGGAPTSYRIWRRAPGLGERQLKALVSDTGNTGTTYSDENVQQGIEYVYRVQALGDEGAGAKSRPVRVTAAREPAVTEELGRVEPEGYSFSGKSIITWDYNQDFEVSGYRILRSRSGSNERLLDLMETSSKKDVTFTDHGVSVGVEYTYRVQVVSGDRVGPKSEAITITVE